MRTPKKVRGGQPFAKTGSVRRNPLDGALIDQQGLTRQLLHSTVSENGTTETYELALDATAATVEALARALELHDYRRGTYGETAAHTTRVTQLGLILAEQVAPELVLEPQLAYGFRLHDIGMIGVSNATLIKPGPLSPAEIDEIREHPWLGERIVAPVPALGGLTRQVIACHHERWDGSGYPRGLRGAEVPLAARIFAVTDAYDALTNDQPYRNAVTQYEALEEIRSKAGLDFDPTVVEAFLTLEVGPAPSGHLEHP
jgi:HD-GYP domain-containing protein (c-di-GMP phosphodiesterase class II)